MNRYASGHGVYGRMDYDASNPFQAYHQDMASFARGFGFNPSQLAPWAMPGHPAAPPQPPPAYYAASTLDSSGPRLGALMQAATAAAASDMRLSSFGNPQVCCVLVCHFLAWPVLILLCPALVFRITQMLQCMRRRLRRSLRSLLDSLFKASA